MLGSNFKMKKSYKKEVQTCLNRTKLLKPALLLESDIQHLPAIVQKYLRTTGVIGKEKVLNVRAKFEGRIRSQPQQKGMAFSSVQYNFFDDPTRIFYIKAYKAGIPVNGMHLYKNEKAVMIIKLAGLFKVVDAKGKEMNQGETVTVLNDMCVMAPATLTDKNLQWEVVDPLSVKVTFTNGNITISATLFFNESGELINFKSNDRFETADGKTYKNYPWSTPIHEYKDINGYHLASSASIIYHRPEGDFCYGDFLLKEIEYNCKTFK
jgi:hypothetical protein